jgi:hypothetical protein
MEWEDEDGNPGEKNKEVKTEPLESDDEFNSEELLTTKEELRDRIGQSGGGKVEAWKPVGSRGKQVITRYDPRNAPRMRLQKASEVDDMGRA